MRSAARRILSAALAGTLAASCSPLLTPDSGPTRTVRRSAPSPQVSAVILPSGRTTPASFSGRVLGLDGKPAAGVSVRGHLVSNNGGGLVSNNGSGYRVAASALETTTNAAGEFSLSHPEGLPLNLEAIKSDQEKALRFAVAPDEKNVTLQLERTGAISGRVVAEGVTDLINVDVFVPGTGYLAKTDAAGHYTIAHVPVGRFNMYAVKRGLGHATAAGVTVRSEQTTDAPELRLELTPPVVSAVSPAAAGPGAEITITGEHFGAEAGAQLAVTIGGAAVSAPTRVDASTIRAVVPGSAVNGDLVVSVDGVSGAPKPFRVVSSIATTSLLHDLVPGDVVQLPVVAVDTAGAAIPDAQLSWRTEGTGFVVDDTGALTATEAGSGKLKVTSGLVGLSDFAVRVHDAPWVITTLAGFETTSPFDRDDSYVASYEGVGSGVELEKPRGIVMAPDGRLFVADQRGVINRVSTEGSVKLFAGSGVAGYFDGAATSAAFTEPSGLALDAAGTLYVCDRATVRSISRAGEVKTLAGGAATGFTDGAGAEARFNRPNALAVDASGNLYVADTGNHAIRKVTPDGTVTTLAGGAAPTGSSDRSYADGTGSAARFNQPEDIAIGPDGNLYVADFGSGRIRRVTPEGAVTTVAGYDGVNLGSSQNHGPLSLTVAPDGVIWTGGWDGYVRKVPPDGEATVVAPAVSGATRHADGADAQAGFRYLRGICRDTSGALYVTEWEYDYVRQRVRRLKLKP